MAFTRLEHNLQRKPNLLRHPLQRIHNLPRQRVLHSIRFADAAPLLARPRRVEVDRVDALVGFGFFLLGALEAEAFLGVHAARVVAGLAAAAAAEEGLHLGHHVCVWLLLLLLLLLPLLGRLGLLEGCLAGAGEVEGVEIHLVGVGDVVDFFNAWMRHCGGGGGGGGWCCGWCSVGEARECLLFGPRQKVIRICQSVARRCSRPSSFDLCAVGVKSGSCGMRLSLGVSSQRGKVQTP